MRYTLRYSHTKHGRIRLSPEWELILSIPHSQAKNEIFKQKMLEKWKLLLQKYQNTSLQTLTSVTKDEVLLFWEYISLKNITHLETFLKEKLLEASLPLLEKYSAQIEIPYNKLTFWLYKTKRGSCSATQNITLNMKLVHLPKHFLEYVIIHEVCHLKVKNHSPKFWKCVGEFFPNYKEVRKYLKALHVK